MPRVGEKDNLLVATKAEWSVEMSAVDSVDEMVETSVEKLAG